MERISLVMSPQFSSVSQSVLPRAHHVQFQKQRRWQFDASKAGVHEPICAAAVGTPVFYMQLKVAKTLSNK